MCKRSVGYTILVPCHGKWKNNTCQSNNQMLKKTYFNITSPLNIRVGNVEGSMVHRLMAILPHPSTLSITVANAL